MTRVALSGVYKNYCRLQGSQYITRFPSLLRNPEKYWFWSLKDLGLEISAGQRLGIIGSNGSGKTTLLRIIAGVTNATHGSVRVKGRVVSLLDLFSGLQGDFTGRENIYLNGLLLGMRRREIDRKLESIVDFAGISEFIEMPVKHYSTGMLMRLAFSVGVHVEAEILLIDEAWGVGDDEFQRKSLARVEALNKNGAALLLVSHDMEILRQHTTETLWLNKGSSQLFGRSTDVIASYLKHSHSEQQP
jgi:ABC-type polysaccharide/polyol phosphate transport system ATPase subunit